MKGLLLVAHGSRREESNKEFEAMVSLLKKEHLSSYFKVEAVFLEFARPGLDEALHAMIHEGLKEVQIYPFFLNSGKHVHHDIPEKICEVQALYPDITFKLLPHFGSSLHIQRIIALDLENL